jgi:Ca2+-binding EF-hand superfamily protein
MTSQHWMNGVKALGLGLIALAGTASAQSREASGPLNRLEELQEHGRILFKLVDENNDGQISQKEAIDAGNLLAGGFFFRADANGDGVVSADEARQARDTFLAQKPWLRFVIGRVESSRPANSSTSNPAILFMGLVDANNDRQLQASEVRQSVQTAVQGLFALADTNRDGLMSPTEVNAAIVAGVKAAEQATFQTADTNHDGQISKEEFIKALTDPANAAFAILDANSDGQLSEQELQSAGRIVENQIQRAIVPEPANSLRNLIQSGRTPEQVAPVPVIPVQVRPNPGAAPVAPNPR